MILNTRLDQTLTMRTLLFFLLFLGVFTQLDAQQHHIQSPYRLIVEGQKYYYVDQSGNQLLHLGIWEIAEPFDHNGLAIVGKGEKKYVLDQLGNTYLMTSTVDHIHSEVNAFVMTWEETEEHFPSTLMTFPQLEILILDRPKYDDLKHFKLPKSIKELSGLRYLSLANHRAEHLPHTITALQSLLSLNLEGNYFTDFPKVVLQLKQLQFLSLKHCQLNSIDLDLSGFTALSNLNLSWNNLNELPNSLSSLLQLRLLDLSGNEFISLPKSLTLLSDLEQLILLKNRLTSLPPGIGHLKQLKILNLLGNKLTHLPLEVCFLGNLEHLDLSFNRLTALPNDLNKLTKLRTLHLGHNPLSEDEINRVVKQLPWLEELNLKNLNLTNIPEEVLALKHLKRLYLGDQETTLHKETGNQFSEEEQVRIMEMLPDCEVQF